MQRWILVGIIAVVLVIGGGGFAFRTYRQNLPDKVWVPLPLNNELPREKRKAIAKDLEAKLLSSTDFAKISEELGLAQTWKLPSDEAGGAEIRKRLFVILGDADTPSGPVPAVHIGVRGKVKEHQTLGKLSMRLMDEVRRIIKAASQSMETF